LDNVTRARHPGPIELISLAGTSMVYSGVQHAEVLKMNIRIGAALALFAAATTATAQDQVTFAKDVAPILQRACQNCHRPGNIGPMSLLTYQEVRPWARSIKQQVMMRNMPPWFQDRAVGIQKFKDDPSLTDQEIAVI
jgi:hypothetical protein